ncbi:Protein of unknown function [Pyronema omphalodes CBS 100304]|uniref:Uncharacterized protein n=1 Tax=Pyronema omphalodes (strain CBS 100304) TaxID=1076935 RepID=U4LHQ1_PYROM|nr:Protein of unknown function [Pyronema omphalodes CBS 100304]
MTLQLFLFLLVYTTSHSLGVPLPNAQPAQLAPPQQETIDLLIQRVDRILPPPHQNAAIGGIILLCRSIRPDD